MKLSAKTISVLKNFATINPSIWIKPGKVISTISPLKTALASAVVDDEFPSDLTVYDLSRFLSVLSIFKEPELEFKEKFVTIKSGNQKINYVFAKPDTFVTPPKTSLNLPSVDVQFALDPDVLNSVMNARAVLGLPEIAIVGEEGKLFIKAVDPKNASGDIYSVEIGKTEKTFNMIFKGEYLKFLPLAYDVSISAKGFAHFANPEVNYWLPTEKSSTFKG